LWTGIPTPVLRSCAPWVRRCKAGLVAATRTRAQADDDIVAALNHYTKALQDAVTSVSRGALLSVTL